MLPLLCAIFTTRPRRTLCRCHPPFAQDELATAMKELKSMRKTTDDMNQVILQLAQAQVRQLQMMETLTTQMAVLFGDKRGVQD